MATYREVVNVPSVPGTDELIPEPWAAAVIDYGITHGFINTADTHRDDWLEIVGSGRYWTFEYRQNMPERVGNLEDDVVALASSMRKQLTVNALALTTHDAIMSVLRANDTQIKALQSRVTETETNIANLMLLLPPPPPTPTGDWWDTQRTAALATLTNDWGPAPGSPVHTTKQIVDSVRGDFTVRDVNGRGIQAQGTGVASHVLVQDCGRTTLPTHSPRDPGVHLGESGGGVDFTLVDSKVIGGKIQGAAAGNTNTVTLRRVEFVDNSDGHKQNDGVAVAACVKAFDFAVLTVEDAICRDNSAPGLWMDGSGWRNAAILRGLYQNLTAPAIFFELGKNGSSADATIINCDDGYLIDADDITITGAAIYGCSWPVRIRPGPRGGLARGVQASFTNGYVEFTATTQYGMARTWANNGARSFVSDFNTFAGLDPSWDVFRWGDLNGGPVQSYNFAGWQGLGFDLNTVLI